MKLIIAFIITAAVNTSALCQIDQVVAGQQTFQKELLETYHNLRATKVDRIHINKLKVLPFFAFDSSFRVHATLDTTTSREVLEMKTSRGRVALYRRYGELSFSIRGRAFRMPVYQSQSAGDAKGELFFPFTDQTNGETTYGGGRYIDLPIPKQSMLILDFNRAYNPYCAYSHVYSCEIPPAENRFPIRIEAGLKYSE